MLGFNGNIVNVFLFRPYTFRRFSWSSYFLQKNMLAHIIAFISGPLRQVYWLWVTQLCFSQMINLDLWASQYRLKVSIFYSLQSQIKIHLYLQCKLFPVQQTLALMAVWGLSHPTLALTHPPRARPSEVWLGLIPRCPPLAVCHLLVFVHHWFTGFILSIGIARSLYKWYT